MANYFVRKTGNDTTGDGSTGNPWLTISKAYSVVVSGDTVKVGAGTYAESTGGVGYLSLTRDFASLGITIESESGLNDVIITGTSGNHNTLPSGTTRYTTFRNVTFACRVGSLYAFAVNATIFGGLQTFTFENCLFTADIGTTSYPLYLLATNSGGTLNYTFTGCTFDQPGSVPVAAIEFLAAQTNTYTFSFNNCIVNAPATRAIRIELAGAPTLNINGGKWTAGGVGKICLMIGKDGSTGNGITGGTIQSAEFYCTVSHTVLLGAGCNNLIFRNNRVRGGDHAIVMKKCLNCQVISNEAFGGTHDVVLLKGATSSIFRGNTVIVTGTNAAAISNYDGDATFTTSGSTVEDNRLITSHAQAMAIEWHASGDSGGNVVNRNTYDVRSGNYGTVLGSASIASLAALRTAWASYATAGNDSLSVDATDAAIIEYNASTTADYFYTLVTDDRGWYWTGTAFEAPTNANRGTYARRMAEDPTGSYRYISHFPTLITTAGTYRMTVFDPMSYAPAVGDPEKATRVVVWGGTGEAAANLASGMISAGRCRLNIPRPHHFIPTAVPSSAVLYGPSMGVPKASKFWGYAADPNGAGGYSCSFTPDEIGHWTLVIKDASGAVVHTASFECVAATESENSLRVQNKHKGTIDWDPIYFKARGTNVANSVTNAGNTYAAFINADKWVIPYDCMVYGMKIVATPSMASMDWLKFFVVSGYTSGTLRGITEDLKGHVTFTGSSVTIMFRNPVPARAGDSFGYEVKAGASFVNTSHSNRRTTWTKPFTAIRYRPSNVTGVSLTDPTQNTFSAYVSNGVLECYPIISPPSFVVAGHSFYSGFDDGSGTNTVAIPDYNTSGINIPYNATSDIAALMGGHLGVPVLNCAVGGSKLSQWVGAPTLSGSNADDSGAGWFEHLVAPYKPAAMLFDTDYNDANPANTYATDVPAYLGYIDQLLWHCRKYGVELILMESPPSYSAAATAHITNLERFRKAKRAWARQNDICNVPSYYAMGADAGVAGEAAHQRYTLKTGHAYLPSYDAGSRVHFSHEGRKAFAALLAEGVRLRKRPDMIDTISPADEMTLVNPASYKYPR